VVVEGFSPSRKQAYAAIRFDGDSTVTIEFDFFCGVGRYVALTLIGDLAKRNFAEKHHII
jgi:hypothetical protein